MIGDSDVTAGGLPWPQASLFVLRTIETLLRQQAQLESRQVKLERNVNIGIGVMLVMQVVLTLVGGAILTRLP